MLNIGIILVLLFFPYGALALSRLSKPQRGRISAAFVFLFTGVGHFIKTAEMTQMLPDTIPVRTALIHFTGVFELVAAICLLIPRTARPTGIVLCVFLLLVLPSNVYAALMRIDFGGHAAGPIYLLARIPLQCLLIGWIYWFAVRQPRNTP